MGPFLLWSAVTLLFLVGLAGTIVPGIPGISLVFVGVLLYGFVTEFASISVTTVVVFGVLTALAMFADYFGSIYGTKKGGGAWKSITGALFGTVLGAFFGGPAGLFAGAFAGALIGAFFEKKQGADALRVASFTVLGIVGSAIVQFFLGLAMIVGFFVALLF